MAFYRKHRNMLLHWVRRQLIGPPPKDEEGNRIIATAPLDLFPTGVLYPVVKGERGLDYASDEDEDGDDALDALDDQSESEPGAKATCVRRRYAPPSAIGFSFFIGGDEIRIGVRCAGATYAAKGDRDGHGRYQKLEWQRNEVGDDCENLFPGPPEKRVVERYGVQVLSGRARIEVLWRPVADGWIATVSFINKKDLPENADLPCADFRIAQNESSIFESSLVCTIESGEVGAYPRIDRKLLTKEERELELQYKNHRIYAVGHGTSVDWILKDGRVKELRTEFLPMVEVPQMTVDVAEGKGNVLGLARLSRIEDDPDGVCGDIQDFIEQYSQWAEGQKQRAANLDSDEIETGEKITERMDKAVKRMRAGCELLRNNGKAAYAFAKANEAMLRQMIQADKCREKQKDEGQYRWRPFQLAFLLALIESVVDEERREDVDLIWFPTGGGKTEAYLGLIAFAIVWRRVNHKDTGGGTTVLMRYTLKLLTGQQFERATRMICALELIRQKDPRRLGAEPISSGMWVGRSASPNSFKEAKRIVDDALQGGAQSPPRSLVLYKCPWCGARFDIAKNFVATERNFYFRCGDKDCEFGATSDGRLPCNVVDEALYGTPSTLLVATLDKFARLAWSDQTNAFFGVEGNRPPELIVQDELHLISGALGSIAGVYESAIDTVIWQRCVSPKYVASTATIRMAENQCRLLFGRENVSVFPPPGLSCEDSYFSRTVPVEEKPGRMYVGYLAPLLNRQRCMAPVAAILMAAPEVVFSPDVPEHNILQEAWWTQVVYHGSIRGVGNSHNSFDVDVREIYSRIIQQEKEINPRLDSRDLGRRKEAKIAELTSRSSPEENARTFSKLENTMDDEGLCLDVALATNMISVGLDVSRLALMIINGQPLTTAEYIQASSRVGRGETPGIVVANYYRDQARSLSHYENFRAYHESFYRFVEPSSITPYTYQARKRALHAALVIALRHSCPDLLPNDGAANFDKDDNNAKVVVEKLKQRCEMADKSRSKETEEYLARLIDTWHAEAEKSRMERRSLKYWLPGTSSSANRLLYSHEDLIKGTWATLHSMRNVEKNAIFKIL